jgi:epoxide hydrolase 4
MQAPTWQHQTILTNGVRLHYVTQGEGPLMLMLHGFPEFWYSWRHQIPEFAKDHKVVAVDLRGYNESDKPSDLKDYRMRELVEDVRGIITGLGYDRCLLVGHDWGGAIAWNFAYSYADLVDRLIVLNLPHPAKLAKGLRLPQQLLKSWYIFAFQLPLLPELALQAFDHQLVAKVMTGMAVDKSAFSEADLAAYRQASAKPGALTAMLNYYRANFLWPDFLVGRNWSVLPMPTLLIWGEEDSALSKELTYGTEQYVANLTLHYIPNCSHWVQQEQPQLVNHYMRNFLSN